MRAGRLRPVAWVLSCALLACSCRDEPAALPTTDVACDGCHGGGGDPAPPLDLDGNAATTFTGVGAHQAHLGSAISSPVACDECHVAVVTGSEPAHMDGDGVAEVTFGALADSDGVISSWDGATCTTYCHGATLDGGGATAPDWTVVNGTQDDCDDCHGYPPPSPHPVDSNCSACHVGVVNADDVTFADASRHVDGIKDVTITACNACHGSVISDAPPQDTAGNMDTTFTGVGAHQTHVNPVTPISAPIACDACHVAVGPADYTHADGQVDMNPAAGWDTVSSCSSSYCHDGARDGTDPTPTWTFAASAAPLGCDSCHGNPPTTGGHPPSADCSFCHGDVVAADDASFAAPARHIDGIVDVAGCNSCHGDATDYTPFRATDGSTTFTDVGVGGHQGHLGTAITTSVSCATCHTVPADLAHVDSVPAELDFTGLGAGTIWDSPPTSCSSTYCHGDSLAIGGGSDTAPDWTTADGAPLACGSCHGNPPPAPHVGNTDCNACHDTVIDPGNTSFVGGGTFHIDGSVQYSALTCTTCHGTDGVNSAPPTDTSGGSDTTSKSVGAHQSHLNTSVTAPLDCDSCHVPVGGADFLHADGAVDMNFTGLGSSTSWTEPTCSSTYCHGDALAIGGGSTTTPTWTAVSGSPLPCGSCHGSPPTPANGHPDSLLCGDCHPATADNTPLVTGPGEHMNAAVTYDLTDSPCTASGCHSWPTSGSHSDHEGQRWCTACHYLYAGGGSHYDGTSDSGTGLVDFQAGGSYNGTSCWSLPGCHGMETW